MRTTQMIATAASSCLGLFASALISFAQAASFAPAAPGASAPAPSTATETSPGDAKVLRICAATQQLPFSSADGSGFENKIGVAIADAMGRKPEFVWASKPAIYLVRDFLDKKACDVIIGLDTGDERVLTTKPYYRTGYVFLSRADRDLTIKSWTDPKIEKLDHIVFGFGSPAEVMLKQIGKYEEDVSYVFSLVGFKSPRNQYVQVDPSKMVSEVASGNADLASAFAPEVARYVKASPTPLRMTMVEDNSVRDDGLKVPQRFDQSMGVRKDDNALLEELNEAIVKARPKIEAILKEEGVPLLDQRS
jgi:mxaJ protein